MTAVVSGGTLEQLHRAWAPAYMNQTMRLYGDLFADYATLYRTQPNVRTVVEFRARNIAQLGIKLYRRTSDQVREHLFDHPFAQLMRRPAPRLTRYRMVRDTFEDQGVYGNAMWAKVSIATPGGPRFAVVRLPAGRVSVQGNNWIRPDFYRIQGNADHLDLQPEQVVHLAYYNPDDARIGLSPLETLRRILAEEAAAGEYRENFWKNAARMELILQRPANAPKWSDPARKRFKSDWKDRYVGAEGSGDTPILEDGMEAKQVSFSAKDSEYISARKLTREESAAAYHISPAMIGILEHANFANIKEQHQMLYQDALGPPIEEFVEEMELQLLPDFDADPALYLEINIEEKLRGSFEEQAGALQSAVGAPWMLRDEARALRNLSPLPNGEGQLIVTPLNVLEGALASPNDTAPKSTEVDRARRDLHVEKTRQILVRYFDRQRDSVLRGLGKTSGQIFDPERWSSELETDLVRLSDAIEEISGKGFDPGRIADVARKVNDETRDLIARAAATEDQTEAVREIFAKAANGRATAVARAVLCADEEDNS